MSDISLFKPSMTIANSVPLSARQLDFFNYLLKGAYQQLEKNYVLDTFIFSYEEIKKFNKCIISFDYYILIEFLR